jgi:hypothetical protein
MRADHREASTEFIGINVPLPLARELKRRAREDDRTLSAYLRRLLASIVLRPAETTDAEQTHG